MRTPPTDVRSGLVIMVALIAAGTLLVSPTVSATPGLLSGVRPGQASPTVQPDASAHRSRYVTIDVAALSEALAQGPVFGPPPLHLELFPDVSVLAVFDRLDASPQGPTWVGHVNDVPSSSVTLAPGGGQLTASIRLPNATYSIRPAPVTAGAAPPEGQGLHIVSHVDQGAFLPEAPPIEVVFSGADLEAAAGRPMSDTADVIDVLVVYTATAMAHAGGSAGINNLINLAVSETNTSYANSQIAQRIRLVHAAEVPYTEVSSFSTNLSILREGLGLLSGVAALRDAYRADLVAMLVHPTSPSACGVAYVMTNVSTAFASSGFSVTDTNCIFGLTLAHELGHNMGAQHDWYVNANTRPYSYAHGYVNPRASQRWRTIMAYNRWCSDQGFTCSRVLHWSNPDVLYGIPGLPACTELGLNCDLLRFWYFPGATMGVPPGTGTSCQVDNLQNPRCDADNRRTLNNTALSVANFREMVPAGSGAVPSPAGRSGR